MDHFSVVCSRSHRVKELTIVNNNKQIDVKTLTLMWGYFNFKSPLESESISIYEEIAKPLFEEFVQYEYSQIVCQVLTQHDDEMGITIVKNNDKYISLDISNRTSWKEITENMCRRTERIILIELFACNH